MMASGAGGDVMQQFGISGVQGPQSKPVLLHDGLDVQEQSLTCTGCAGCAMDSRGDVLAAAATGDQLDWCCRRQQR